MDLIVVYLHMDKQDQAKVIVYLDMEIIKV